MQEPIKVAVENEHGFYNELDKNNDVSFIFSDKQKAENVCAVFKYIRAWMEGEPLIQSSYDGKKHIITLTDVEYKACVSLSSEFTKAKAEFCFSPSGIPQISFNTQDAANNYLILLENRNFKTLALPKPITLYKQKFYIKIDSRDTGSKERLEIHLTYFNQYSKSYEDLEKAACNKLTSSVPATYSPSPATTAQLQQFPAVPTQLSSSGKVAVPTSFVPATYSPSPTTTAQLQQFSAVPTQSPSWGKIAAPISVVPPTHSPIPATAQLQQLPAVPTQLPSSEEESEEEEENIEELQQELYNLIQKKHGNTMSASKRTALVGIGMVQCAKQELNKQLLELAASTNSDLYKEKKQELADLQSIEEQLYSVIQPQQQTQLQHPLGDYYAAMQQTQQQQFYSPQNQNLTPYPTTTGSNVYASTSNYTNAVNPTAQPSYPGSKGGCSVM
jgi:hypothetical protein